MWLTGICGAGKTTLAEEVCLVLRELGLFAVLYDGDLVRRGLCAGLGFSAEDRAENVRRVAEAALLVNLAGGVAVVALVSPHAAGRLAAEEIHCGRPFFEVFVDTPLSVCEERDPKGHYRAAREGRRKLVGVDLPYERPDCPDHVTDWRGARRSEAVRLIEALHLAEVPPGF